MFWIIDGGATMKGDREVGGEFKAGRKINDGKGGNIELLKTGS